MKNLGLLLLLAHLLAFSCHHHSPKKEVQDKISPDQFHDLITNITIENRINRGINYTDSLETNYSLRYIPVIITNNNILPIQFQMTFFKEYEYPIAYGDQEFNVLPMPREWALDQVEITEGMLKELSKHINNPSLNKRLEPGEALVIGIGTLYPRPTNCGVLPKQLFIQNGKENFPDCDWQIEEEQSSNSEVRLGLKLNYCESCMVIPCGQITFLNH